MREASWAIGVGGLLIVLGVGAYAASGAASITGLIPTFFGLPILVLGWVARTPNRTKTAMHVVAVLALLAVLGSLRVIPLALTWVQTGEGSLLAMLSQIVMLLASGTLLTVCIMSFIRARRARAGAA